MIPELRSRLTSIFGAVIALLAACACALGSVALSTVEIGERTLFWPLALIVLGGALAAVLRAARRNEPFHPYAIVALIALLLFGARFVYLGLATSQLVDQSYRASFDPVDSLLALRSQEIAKFVHGSLIEPWDQALTRAMLAVALFFGMFAVGHRLTWGQRLADRLAQVGDRAGRHDMRMVIVLWLGIALVAQAVVLVNAGGIGAATQNILTQRNFDAGLVILVLASFGPIGLLIWVSWHWPTETQWRLAFAIALGEIVAFYALLGSRALVLTIVLLLIVARHFRVRPWRIRTLAVGFGVAVAFFTAYLAVRQASYDAPVSAALRRTPTYLVDPRGILNDTTAFDDVLYVTSLTPDTLPFRYGGEVVDTVRTFLPTFVDPDRPVPFEVRLRYVVAGGGEVGGGRPPTLIGELWLEAGFATVALGALLFGILARGLGGLVSGGRDSPGAPLRVALYAVAVVLLLETVIGSWSVAIGFALYLLVPLGLALIAHPSRRRTA